MDGIPSEDHVKFLYRFFFSMSGAATVKLEGAVLRSDILPQFFTSFIYIGLVSWDFPQAE